jgi:hypothetical protein
MRITKSVALWACAVVAVFVCGCSQEGNKYQDIDQGLVDTWINDPTDVNLDNAGTRKFSIKADGSFECSIAPVGQPRGTVTGVLVAEKGEYIMTKLKGITGNGWELAVGGYNGKYVQITFSGNDIFEFSCADDETVTNFFGGTYYRLPNTP